MIMTGRETLMNARRHFHSAVAFPAIVLVSVFRSDASPPPGGALTLTKEEAAVVKSVAGDRIREVTTRLASVEMEGRGAIQPGGEKAARYIADQFSSIGLKPIDSSGSYFQSVGFTVARIADTSRLTVGKVSLSHLDEFVVSRPAPSVSQDVRAGVVLVGFGVVSEELGRNDLEGVDVNGRIAVLLRGTPRDVDAKTWAQISSYSTVSAMLRQRGAVGILMVRTDEKERPFSVYVRAFGRKRVSLAGSPGGSSRLMLPGVIVSEAGARKLFAAANEEMESILERALDGKFVSEDLDLEAHMHIVVETEQGSGSNVVGVLEGSDEQVNDEAVVFTAHYDGYGVDSEGEIHFGAGDNAVGVGMITGIARAVIESGIRPRRSMIFIALTAEEHGLLGSRYWVQHPTWPLKKVVANLNFDGIGTETYGPVKAVVAFGAEHSELGGIVEDAAAANGVEMIDDPMPEESIFTRSDHYNFVREGIPALMLLGSPDVNPDKWMPRVRQWLKTDYHQPTDTVAVDWDWSGPQTLASIGAVAGMRVANTNAWPGWLSSSRFFRERNPGSSTGKP